MQDRILYLFDASSIINLVRKGFVKVFRDGVTCDLALYESLNALWKEYELLRRIDKETVLEFIDLLHRIFDVLEKISISGYEQEVLNRL